MLNFEESVSEFNYERSSGMKRRGLACKSPSLRSREVAPAKEANGTGQSLVSD